MNIFTQTAWTLISPRISETILSALDPGLESQFYRACSISSSSWQWFCIEALTGGSHRKYTKDNRQLLVAGKRLTLGVRRPGEKPSWGQDVIE